MIYETKVEKDRNSPEGAVQIWAPFAAFSIVVVASFFTWWSVTKTFDSFVKEDFLRISDQISGEIEGKYREFTDFLSVTGQQIQSFQPKYEPWGTGIGNLNFIKLNREVRSIFHVVTTTHADLPSFVDALKTHRTDFAVFPKTETGPLRIVVNAFSEQPGGKLVGFNVATAPILNSALEQSLALNMPVLTRQLNLPVVKWARGEMLLFLPVQPSGRQRAENNGLTEFVGLSFFVKDFFRPLTSKHKDLAFRVIDKADGEQPQYLFESLTSSISEVTIGDTLRQTKQMVLGGRSIELEIWATEQFRKGDKKNFDFFFMALGLVAALLAAVFTKRFVYAEEKFKENNRQLAENVGVGKVLLETVLDSSIDGIVSVNEQGDVVAYNKQAEKIFGYGKEFSGKKLSDCLLNIDGNEDALKVPPIEPGNQPPQNDGKLIEMSAVRGDGRIIPVSVSIKHGRFDDKDFTSVHVRDNSDRLKAEGALKSRTEELHDKIKELSVLNAISSLKERGGATLEEMLGGGANALSEAISEGTSTGVKITVDDAFYYSEGFQDSQTFLEHSFHVRGSTYGKVELHFLPPQTIKPFHRRLIKTIGSRLAEACEAKLAEEALRSSEGRFRDIVEIASDWFWEMDENLRFSYMSDRFFETMGIHGSEIIGKRINEVEAFGLVDGDLAKVRQNENILERRQPFRNFEYLVSKSGGQQSFIRISGHPLYDENGRFTGYRGAGTDITSRKRAEELIREANTALEVRVEERTQELKAEIGERKKAEEALKDSEQRFKDVAEASSDWIWETDSQFKLTHLSERISDLMDLDAKQMLGKGLFDAGLEVTSENDIEELRTILKNHLPFRDRVFKIVDLSGETHFFKASAKPVFDVDKTFLGYRGTASDITEQTQSEITLYRLSRAIEHSPSIIIITDPDGRIEYVNPRFQEITGFSFADVLGKLPEAFRLSREKAPGYENIWETVSSGAEWSGIVLEHKKSGESFWASVSYTSVTDDAGKVLNYIGAAEDITERKEAEEQIRFQASLLKQVRNAVIATGLDGRIHYLNKHAEELWGITLEDALESNFSEFVNIGMRPERQAPGWGRIGRDYYEGEFYAKRADGSTFPAFMTTSKLTDSDGNDIGFIRVVLDLTERKKVDAQLVQASKLATIGEMAAGMAHELNQPINIIRMTADAGIMDIDDGLDVPESRREVLSLISDQSQRMAEIIDHMRVLSRKDEEQQELFSPKEAVIAVADLLDRQFEASGVALNIDVPEKNEFVRGRRVQLEQVILNLLTNARDAIESLKAEKGPSTGKVTIKVTNDAKTNAVVIVVADTGGGVPDEYLNKIFEPFYTTKAAGKGTGLGLSVSMSLINRMNGSIKVRNAKQGAEFTISLPISDETKKTAGDSKKGAQKSGVGKKQAGHILIVDDEIEATRILARFVKKYGYAVTTAFNGKEALEFFQERPADLVVTDMRMPEMGGKDLISALRKDFPDLPVIAVSGQMEAEDEKFINGFSTTQNGNGQFQRFFKKPVDLTELMEAIEEMLDK